MSEFTSSCPKCRQAILCDTAYVGMRVACPVCLQEIIMPKPGPNQTPSQLPGATQSNSPANGSGAKKSRTKLFAVVGGIILIIALAAGGIMIALHRAPSNTSAQPPVAPVVPVPDPATPSPAAIAPAPAADQEQEVPLSARPDVYTNYMVLETKSFLIKITEVRQKNVTNDLSVIYSGMDKNYSRGITLKGEDTYEVDTNGVPLQLLGWTFRNGDITYYVSDEGDLKVTQGENVLVSDRGQWRKKPQQR